MRRSFCYRPSLSQLFSQRVLLCMALLLVAFLPSLVVAQADSLFRDFAREDKFVLTVDGVVDETAQIYRSQRAAAFLVLTRSLTTPFVVVPRSQQVQAVDLMKVSQKGNGNIDLLADAVLSSLGGFQLSGTDIAFTIDSRAVVLKEKPNLVGAQSLAEMQGSSKTYVQLQDAYTPGADAMKLLRAADDIKVVVYFGSWCPFCGQYVPRIMKVAKDLGEQGARIEFYGLEPGFGSDPNAKAAKITGVPTGVVFRNGREIGRLRNDAWKNPDKSLSAILQK